jgi:probable blue pigment (indigoidine) exporter
VLTAAVLFSLVGVTVRFLVTCQGESVFWLGWLRFAGGGLVLLVGSMAGACSLRVNNRQVFVWRGLFGATGMFLMFVAIALVGLGRGTILIYLMVVFGAIAGVFVLGERPKATTILAIAVGLVGLSLSCRSGVPVGAEWLAVAGAVCCGVALALIRRLRRTDSNTVVFFSQCLFGSVLLLPFLARGAPPSTPMSWGVVMVMIVGDMTGSLCMNEGLSRIPVAVGGAILLLTPILSVLIGAVFFKEQLSIMQWLGALMVLGSAFLVVRASSRSSASPVATKEAG